MKFSAQYRTQNGGLVKPVGVLVSEEKTSISMSRYGDRPEGIDQFGAEELERDGDCSGGAPNEFWKGMKNQPEGIDQFGGEQAEHH